MSRLEDIRQRRSELLARAAVERERLWAQLAAWERPVAMLDRGVRAVRRLRAHPEWAFAAACILVLLRPRGALLWVRRGFAAWRLWRWASLRVRNVAGSLPR